MPACCSNPLSSYVQIGHLNLIGAWTASDFGRLAAIGEAPQRGQLTSRVSVSITA
jgi:hypothetical protein